MITLKGASVKYLFIAILTISSAVAFAEVPVQGDSVSAIIENKTVEGRIPRGKLVHGILRGYIREKGLALVRVDDSHSPLSGTTIEVSANRIIKGHFGKAKYIVSKKYGELTWEGILPDGTIVASEYAFEYINSPYYKYFLLKTSAPLASTRHAERGFYHPL